MAIYESKKKENRNVASLQFPYDTNLQLYPEFTTKRKSTNVTLHIKLHLVATLLHFHPICYYIENPKILLSPQESLILSRRE